MMTLTRTSGNQAGFEKLNIFQYPALLSRYGKTLTGKLQMESKREPFIVPLFFEILLLIPQIIT